MPTKAVFRVEPRSSQDFSSPQKARTEALRALAVWQARQKGRRFSVVECRDDLVISRLTWRTEDNEAEPDFQATCDARSLRRQMLDGP